MTKWDSNGGSMQETIFWFAVKVRAHFEHRIANALDGKGIETFLPLYPVRRKWSDRVKTIELPLFPGYLFCRIDPAKRMPVLTVPGVHYFVGAAMIPQPLADSEIESIRALARSGAAVPRPYLATGERVRVEDGPLRGVEGVLLHGGDADQLVVSIELLKRSVALTIDRDSLAPLGHRTRHAA